MKSILKTGVEGRGLAWILFVLYFGLTLSTWAAPFHFPGPWFLFQEHQSEQFLSPTTSSGLWGMQGACVVYFSPFLPVFAVSNADRNEENEQRLLIQVDNKGPCISREPLVSTVFKFSWKDGDEKRQDRVSLLSSSCLGLLGVQRSHETGDGGHNCLMLLSFKLRNFLLNKPTDSNCWC